MSVGRGFLWGRGAVAAPIYNSELFIPSFVYGCRSQISTEGSWIHFNHNVLSSWYGRASSQCGAPVMQSVKLWRSGVLSHLLLQTPEPWLVSPFAVPTGFQARSSQGSPDCICSQTLAPEALLLLLGGSVLCTSPLSGFYQQESKRLFIHGRLDNGASFFKEEEHLWVHGKKFHFWYIQGVERFCHKSSLSTLPHLPLPWIIFLNFTPFLSSSPI